jgi:hypothetical protein
MTFFERSVVRSGQPRRIIVGVITLMWVLFSLWFHLWAWAMVALVVGVALGALATTGMHVEELAQTMLGKILLLHLHPVNVALQTFGFAVLLYSFWIHSAVLMLLAISVILLGHMFGWHKVNHAL